MTVDKSGFHALTCFLAKKKRKVVVSPLTMRHNTAMANRGEFRFVALGFILICAISLLGQSTPLKRKDGALAGAVTDSFENAPIAGASIRVNSKTRHWHTNASTDYSGHFMLSLAPDEYELSVVASGFKAERTAVSIVSDKTTRHDSKLRVDDEHLEQHDSR